MRVKPKVITLDMPDDGDDSDSEECDDPQLKTDALASGPGYLHAKSKKKHVTVVAMEDTPTKTNGNATKDGNALSIPGLVVFTNDKLSNAYKLKQAQGNVFATFESFVFQNVWLFIHYCTIRFLYLYCRTMSVTVLTVAGPGACAGY